MSVELSMSKFSEVFKLPLSVVGGGVSGSIEGVFESSIGLGIPLKVEARKIFYNDQCGLLLHVIGDLYLLASHYPKTGGLCIFVIDASKLIMDGVRAPPELYLTKAIPLVDAMKNLRKGIVGSFYYKNGWKPLTLPK